MARFIDRLNTRWLRMSPKVASGALLHARVQGAERIFCGHTHDAMQQQQDGVQYYNAGGWIDSAATYITVGPRRSRRFMNTTKSDLTIVIPAKNEAKTDSAIAEFAGESGLSADAEYENIGR